jgi:excisionase family DNA binding protein
MTAEPWVSVEQIAEHLGVTRDSIYRWIKRKSLPAHRIGRLWKFKVATLLRLKSYLSNAPNVGCAAAACPAR